MKKQEEKPKIEISDKLLNYFENELKNSGYNYQQLLIDKRATLLKGNNVVVMSYPKTDGAKYQADMVKTDNFLDTFIFERLTEREERFMPIGFWDCLYNNLMKKRGDKIEAIAFEIEQREKDVLSL